MFLVFLYFDYSASRVSRFAYFVMVLHPAFLMTLEAIWYLACLILYTKDIVVYALEIEVTHIFRDFLLRSQFYKSGSSILFTEKMSAERLSLNPAFFFNKGVLYRFVLDFFFLLLGRLIYFT